MQGFVVFLGKEFTEIVRTWRLFVIPGILMFIGVGSPVLAEITPELISSMGLEAQGLIIEIPPATTVDAYLQFSKNAYQVALIAVIITTAGAISSERMNGTAQLVLTKPLSRRAMVAAKVLSSWVLLFVALVVAGGLCVGMTAMMFDMTLIREFVSLMAFWYVLASFMVTLTIFLSVVLRSQAAAAGVGILLYFLMSALLMLADARDYSPAGLISAGDRILSGAVDVSVFWPVVTGIAGMFALAAAAAWVFDRQEL